MQRSRNTHTYRPQGLKNDGQTFFSNFAVSGICHLLFFAILFYVPSQRTKIKPSLSFINVSMVTLPALKKTQPSNEQPVLKPESQAVVQKKAPVSKVSTKTVPEKVHKQSKAVSIGPKKKKIKKSLKKKTFKSSKIVKSAITRIEKKVKESRPDHVTKAIDKLKDKVGKTRPADIAKNTNGKSSNITAGSGKDSKKVWGLINIYQLEIAYQIGKNWAFPEQLAGGHTDLEALVGIKIMPNGEIKDIWFDQRSGNSYLDESVKKAIMKSDPVRPHPPGIKKPYVQFGLRFTPEGLK